MISEEDASWKIRELILYNVTSGMDDHYGPGDLEGVDDAAHDIMRLIKEHYVEKKM